MTRRTWSKERVVEAILARQQQGLPVSMIYREDICLYAAGKRFWGSWNHALQAAGLPIHARNWTPRSVIKAILTRQQNELPIHGIARNDASLAAAACRYFGSWKKSPSGSWRAHGVATTVDAATCDRGHSESPTSGSPNYNHMA